MRYLWKKINFFKYFSFSRSKTNFSKFSFVSIDNRFDRKTSEPTANNQSLDGGQTRDSSVESFEFLQPRISLVGRKAIFDDFIVCSSDPFI